MHNFEIQFDHFLNLENGHFQYFFIGIFLYRNLQLFEYPKAALPNHDGISDELQKP